MHKRVCVYCSSSDILEESYKEAAGKFAEAASSLGYTVVCGGSSKGLMGVIIDRINEKGGEVEGVMPTFMKNLEFYHQGLKKIRYVDSLSERKKLLREGTDAVIALPGGLGTLEEFLETFTLKRLGLYSGLTALLNINGYYRGLISLFEQYESEGFLGKNWRDALKIANSVEDLMEMIKEYHPEKMTPAHYAP